VQQPKLEGQKFEFFMRTNLAFKARTDLGTPEGVEERK
jgi:hypothetical protein